MSEKISEYTTSVTALASGDLMDVSKLISTSPDVYQSQKLNYSVLLTELNADLGFIDGSGTTNKISKFTASGTIGDSSISDDGTNVSTLQAVGIGIATPTSKLHIVGDAATQTTSSLLIKNSIGGELIKLLNDGSSLIGINTFAVTDGNAFNNSLGFYTNGTVLKARYKNNAGISSDLVISSNLGSENLTSADDARTFTLKTGTTATQNFQIKNSAGTVGYYFDGANTLNFGDTTKFVKPTIYLDSTLTDQMHIRRGSSTFFVLNPLNYALNLVGPSGYRTDLYGNGQVYVTGPSAGFFADNTAGQRIYRQDIQSGTDCYVLMASGSTNKTAFYAGYGNYFIDNVAIGDTYTFTEKFRVKGSGSTSATTTALFQNSASVSALKVKDDGYCILKANNAAIASGDLANNEMSFYIDEGTNHCVVKVKYSSGTVKTGTFNLT